VGGGVRIVVSWDGPPEVDLAAEEGALEEAAGGRPVLLLWSWPGPVVVLGHGQRDDQVDRALCTREGIPVLRRITGGTGIVHRRDLAVSLALPAGHPWARTIPAAYDGFVGAVAAALGGLGLEVERPRPVPRRSARERSPVCFETVLSETLFLGGRKVLGCAQARRRSAVLVHGLLHREPDHALYAAVFGVPPARVRGAVGGIGPEPGLAGLGDAVTRAFRDALAGTGTAVP